MMVIWFLTFLLDLTPQGKPGAPGPAGVPGEPVSWLLNSCLCITLCQVLKLFLAINVCGCVCRVREGLLETSVSLDRKDPQESQ